MYSTRRTVLALGLYITAGFASLSFVTLCRANAGPDQGTQQPASQVSVARYVGTIKDIAREAITVTSDAGTDVNVRVQDSTRIVRIAPEQKDLKDATLIYLRDLQIGDRILIRGRLSNDGKSILAFSIIAMKRSDVEAKREWERDDWQKRGVGGLVSAVDRGSGTIKISSGAPGANKTIAIHSSKNTILRRYSPDSVKFDDAKLSTLDQIRPGDQLRARGTRSADGTELAAEEIVSGAFRNIVGTIASVDATASTISVMDVMTKKLVLVKITAESQLCRLPPLVAERIAMRLKGAATDAPQASDSTAGTSRPGGSQDLQQVIDRPPAATLGDFQKGDAVMIVSTQGAFSGEVTAIIFLGGVEPILVASPKGSQAMILSPWNLSAPGGDAATP